MTPYPLKEPAAVTSTVHRCAVVIPVYNHGATVASVVRGAKALGFPVVVVDDGSTDDTADKLGATTGIHLVRHGENQGKGAALVTGFREAVAVADWAITMDADGQHVPTDALGLIRAIHGDERPIVIGCRSGMTTGQVPWSSRFGRSFSNFWVKTAGGPSVGDTQSGFRVYPLPEVLDLKVRARRYQYEIEVLVAARMAGIPVVERPIRVDYAPPGGRISHYRPLVDFLRNTETFRRLITRRVLARRFTRFKG